MFTLAILIGIYSYLIFFLGIAGLLYKPVIIGVTVVWVGIVIYIFCHPDRKSPLPPLVKGVFSRTGDLVARNDKYRFLFLSCLLFLQIIINLIGALAPELALDALWYH